MSLPHDIDLHCATGCGLVPHRFRPSPEAGPYWRCSECGAIHDADKAAPAAEPAISVAVSQVARLIAAWHDSQARGGVSRDFATCLSDLAARSGLPVPEFRGVLDGVDEEDLSNAPPAGPFCAVESSALWLCTRSLLHRGDHVARAGSPEILARWPQ